MRLYAGSSNQFIQDATQNQIAAKLKEAFFSYYGFNPSMGEQNAWLNSLRALALVFVQADLTDHGVMFEYQLPMSSKRLDCLITGKSHTGIDQAVIIELKQWQSCEPSTGDGEVVTFVGGAKRDVLHPSVQVGNYHRYLCDTHTAFYESNAPVNLQACSYLHNYPFDPTDVIFDTKFSQHLETYPIFTLDHTAQLSTYLTDHVGAGQGLEVLQRVEESKYRPSKKLMLHVSEVIKGNPQYILLDEQQIVYDKVFAAARTGFHDKKKSVVVIKGGPGTGKSVVAINLMADLLSKGYNAQYATGSKAFTETLRKVIGRRGSVQFKYFNSYMHAEPNEIDVLICDEAHRIREVSHNRFTPKGKRTGLPQIEELINVAKVSVYFIDDDQVVRPNEIGSVDHIKEYAEAAGAQIEEYELEAQFRCNGSDGFVNWINNTLQIRRTANTLWNPHEESFDFQIMNSVEELDQAIRQKADEGETARLMAGFCWPWSKKLNSDGTLKNDVVIGNYVRPWNAHENASNLAKDIPKAPLWAYSSGGIDQIGCVYTAQGFEFDYAGVIFGLDLRYDLDEQTWIGDKTASHDTTVKRSKDKFLDLVKNTYRVLLSRGMKGCYVYFMDKDTERFFKSRIQV